MGKGRIKLVGRRGELILTLEAKNRDKDKVGAARETGKDRNFRTPHACCHPQAISMTWASSIEM